MKKNRPYPVRWFAPGDDYTTDGVPGTYQFDDDGRIEIHVHSFFADEQDRFLGPSRTFPSVLQGKGVGRGHYITAVNCRQVEGLGGFGDVRDATVRATYALEGFFFLDEEDLALTHLRLRFVNQDTWTGWRRFSVKDNGLGPLEDVSAIARNNPEYVARLDAGELRLFDHSHVCENFDRQRWEFQSCSAFEFQFDETVRISEIFNRYVYPLQIMLLSASGRLAGVVEMSGTNTSWEFSDGSNEPPSRWLNIRHIHGDLDPPRRNDLNYLHRLSDINFEEQISQFLKAVNKHEFCLEHYRLLHAEHFAGGHLARFSVAIQLVDAFDRTLHPEDRKDQRLPFRLKRLDAESGGLVESVIGNKNWKNDIAQFRNFVVHGDVNARQVLRDKRSLIAAYEVLLLLFEVRFLVEVGFSQSEATSLIERRPEHWRIRQNIKMYFPTIGLTVG